MDLGTVRTRLDTGFYSSPEEFARDMNLIFDNAKLYNAPTHPVHYAAHRIQKNFQMRFEEVMRECQSSLPDLTVTSFAYRKELSQMAMRLSDTQQISRLVQIIQKHTPQFPLQCEQASVDTPIFEIDFAQLPDAATEEVCVYLKLLGISNATCESAQV